MSPNPGFPLTKPLSRIVQIFITNPYLAIFYEKIIISTRKNQKTGLEQTFFSSTKDRNPNSKTIIQNPITNPLYNIHDSKSKIHDFLWYTNFLKSCEQNPYPAPSFYQNPQPRHSKNHKKSKNEFKSDIFLRRKTSIPILKSHAKNESTILSNKQYWTYGWHKRATLAE